MCSKRNEHWDCVVPRIINFHILFRKIFILLYFLNDLKWNTDLSSAIGLFHSRCPLSNTMTHLNIGWIFFSKKVWPFHQSGTLISGRGWSREPQSRTRRGPSLLLSIGTRSQDTRLSGVGIGLERRDSHQQPWRSIVELSSRLFFGLPDSCSNMCHFGH